MNQVTVVYIDDEINSITEVGQIATSQAQDILSAHPLIDVVPIPTGKLDDILQRTREYQGDIYLVDLDLTSVQQDKTASTFKGSTLADAIRDIYIDVPIVLFTKQSVLDDLNPERRRQILHQSQIFDAIILKDEIYERDQEIRDEIVSLVQGFRMLNDKSPKNITNLYSVIGMTPEEEPHLREVSLPLYEGKWIATEANHWIRHVLAEFPGILYDDLHAATMLGISLEAFLDERVQNILESAKYMGDFPLPQHRRRWWKIRVNQAIQKFIFSQAKLNDPLSATFQEAFLAEFGTELQSSICTWDCTPTADWVCYVRKEPVKLEHTLKYYPNDMRPKIMDEPRVSFRAIRENNDFDPAFLDKKGSELIDKIEKMDDPCAK